MLAFEFDKNICYIAIVIFVIFDFVFLVRLGLNLEKYKHQIIIGMIIFGLQRKNMFKKG